MLATATPPVRVIGCGSPQGDDAVAWEVVRRLRSDERLPHAVELREVEGGHQLLDVLDGRGTLVLVDAVSSGSAPGTIYQFDWPDERLETLRPGTTHHLRPAEALELAAMLGMLPPRVVVFGIEAANIDAASGLSQAVAAAIAGVVDRILEELSDARDVTERQEYLSLSANCVDRPLILGRARLPPSGVFRRSRLGGSLALPRINTNGGEP